MFDWLKKLVSRRSQPTADLLSSLFSVSTGASGVVVNKTTALNCMAYWSGIRLLSESLAVMPLRLYRRKGKAAPDEVTNHRSLAVVVEPNDTQTPFNFHQTGMAHVLTRGNVFAEIVADGAGRPSKLWLMDPDDTEVRWQASGKALEYTSRRRKGSVLPQDRVLHVPGLGFDGVRGYDVVTVANQAIGLAMGAEQYGASWFGSGGKPSGTLEYPGRLTPEAVERQRADWYKIHQPGSHEIAILLEGLKFNPYENDPAKAQALEVRRFQVLEIARLLRIPPHMLFDLDRATFSNIEQMSLEFVTYSLGPWMSAWEQEYARKLLTREERMAGLFFRFDAAALLRGDPHNSADSHSKLVNAGIEKPNEARAVFDLPAVDGGDALRVPLNSAPLLAGSATTKGEA